jgi:hypothetical protein
MYEQTVINYIGDWRIGSPALQLSDVLSIIDGHGLTEPVPRGSTRWLYRLDALHEQICRMPLTRLWPIPLKLLLALASSGGLTGLFRSYRYKLCCTVQLGGSDG